MPTKEEIDAAAEAIANLVAGHLPSNRSLAHEVARAALAAAEAVRDKANHGWDRNTNRDDRQHTDAAPLPPIGRTMTEATAPWVPAYNPDLD